MYPIAERSNKSLSSNRKETVFVSLKRFFSIEIQDDSNLCFKRRWAVWTPSQLFIAVLIPISYKF